VLALADSLALQPGPGCQTSCGGVDVPFPFGIGAGCFLPGFEIHCVNGSMPMLPDDSYDMKVLNLTVMPRPEARVMLHVAFQCYDTTDGSASAKEGASFRSVVIKSAYRISDTRNELVVLGCTTFGFTRSGPWGRGYSSIASGCLAYCDHAGSAKDGSCVGIGCCRVEIPPGLTDNSVTFLNGSDWSHKDLGFSPCDYGFMVEKITYDFRVSDLHMDGKSTRKPLVLDWAIRGSNVSSSVDNMTCSDVANKPGYACLSDNSQCLNSANGPGYICNCTQGYWGNPYLIGGCKGNQLFASVSITSSDRK
jgi:hypothetical protein